jgi:hypothetical protein
MAIFPSYDRSRFVGFRSCTIRNQYSARSATGHRFFEQTGLALSDFVTLVQCWENCRHKDQ